ncbi:MAG: glutamyl-tRNA reductase [Nitrospirota bacterium]|nr:glutamyl-tRNA reductase [Nitrospirota bacterium]
MNIVVVGVSHKTAPVEIRECLAFPEKSLPECLASLAKAPGVNECLILSTCNRVELYCLVQDLDKGAQAVKEFLYQRFHVSDGPEKVGPHLYCYTGTDAVRHTFRVASSLDSMMVGEPQILGQLKEAYDFGLQHKTTGLILNRLMKKAIMVAKRVRTETKISQSAVSISYAAVELARKIFGNLEQKTVMLLGAGEMAELAARHLMNNGIHHVIVATRTYENAVKLAEEFKGEAVRWDDFPRAMVNADILIASTGAPHYIVKNDEMKHVIKERKYRPIFCIDISVPRNIDPAINEIDNVYLYDIDDLQSVVEANIKERHKEAEEAENIIAGEVNTFLEWGSSLEMVPTIVALREKIDGIRRTELEKALPRLDGLDEKQIKAVESLTNGIINKVLHDPMTTLKKEANGENAAMYVEAVRKMFNLDGKE